MPRVFENMEKARKLAVRLAREAAACLAGQQARSGYRRDFLCMDVEGTLIAVARGPVADRLRLFVETQLHEDGQLPFYVETPTAEQIAWALPTPKAKTS